MMKRKSKIGSEELSNLTFISIYNIQTRWVPVNVEMAVYASYLT